MQDFKLNLTPKVLSPSDVGNLIFDYFENLKENGIYTKRPTVAGLALVLNLTPKRLFTYADINFESDNDEEQKKAQIISRSLAHVSEFYESGADDKKNATFNWNMLKALGYPEKTQVDHTISGESLCELAKKAKEVNELNNLNNLSQ